MADQPRWPAGTPWRERGPGPGRFRDESPDWATRAAGTAPLATIELGVNAVSGDGWVDRLVGRLDRHDDYRPGQWQTVSVRQHMADRWAMLVQMFIDQGETEGVARQLAGMMFADARPPQRVYANGPHEVVIELDRDLPEAEILAHVDRLVSQFPPVGPLRLSITPDMPRITGGITLRQDDDENTRSPVIVLTESVFRPGNQENIRATLGPQMPASRTTEPWKYVLTHEWGHVTAAGHAGGHVFEEHRHGLTDYGSGHPSEHYAEAFAEWFLSGGRTTNPAVLAWQQLYGWAVPRG